MSGKWVPVLIQEGEKYFARDIPCGSKHKALLYTTSDSPPVGDKDKWDEVRGTINGHPHGYWMARWTEDNEVNEFGEVTP